MELGLLSLGDHLPDAATGRHATQGERLRAIVEMGVRAEELGFDAMAIGEHHFSEYIVSSPFAVLAAVAARTSRIRLSTAVTLLPILDPVRVAEDFNTVDQLSGGRLEMVLGRGISGDGYGEFGVDPASARQVLVEKLGLLERIWHEESVTWSGGTRPDLDAVTVHPAAAQRDPRVWMGTGMSEDSVRWTAEMGLPLMLPSIFKPAEDWRDLAALYRELMESSGKADRSFIGACSHIHVAPTSRQARDGWRPYLVPYAQWANRLRNVDVTVDFDRIVNGPAVCGSPAEVAERLQSIEDALRPDRHLAVFDIGGMPDELVRRTMELYAAEVMPKLR